MHLSEILSLILEKISLEFLIPCEQDTDLVHPNALSNPEIRETISHIVTNACQKAGLSKRGALGFGEFIAMLMTGGTTHRGNEVDILVLSAAFGQAAYGDPTKVVHIYSLPDWDALYKHLSDIQHGVVAAFSDAKLL
jgi:hypothetical protein